MTNWGAEPKKARSKDGSGTGQGINYSEGLNGVLRGENQGRLVGRIG